MSELQAKLPEPPEAKMLGGDPAFDDVVMGYSFQQIIGYGEQCYQAGAQAQAQASIANDTDVNAPWLSLAHSICTDSGIEQGHIYARLCALRDKQASIAQRVPSSICEYKTNDIIARQNYTKTGYVLTHADADERICVSDKGAVAWFTPQEWWWLMHNRDHVEFDWPKPLGHVAQPVPMKDGDIAALVNKLRDIAVELFTRNADKFTATRRAIVRAAAEIGKAMP